MWSDSDNEINHNNNETVVIVRKTIKYVDDTVVHFTTIVELRLGHGWVIASAVSCRM